MSTRNVLLVDDELHILRATEFKLKRHGYQITCASDGEEAWEQIQRQVPDIVVTDLQMPRLDGLQLITRIRENPATESLPVILLTAKGFELTHKETYERHGVFDVVTKPFSPRNLCQRVDMALSLDDAKSPLVAQESQSQMNLPTEIFGDVIVVHAPEELSDDRSDKFEDFLTSLDLNRVIVDLDATELLDSAGLEALLDAQDRLRRDAGDLKVIANNRVNRKILEVTRLDDHLEVFDSVIDAVKSFV